MFKGKLQIEKIEKVKQIIRAHNYSNYERAHQDCQELGINVNRPALDRFADRLLVTDKEKKQKKLDPVAPSLHFAPSEQQLDATSIEIKPQKTTKQTGKKVTKAMSNTSSLSYGDMQKRQNEITFELGELKIRESELLLELQALKTQKSH